MWPTGCSSIDQVPVDLVSSIAHALKVLSWYENLPKHEIPPEWMWHLDHELEDWWQEVEYLREQKYSNGGSADDEPVVMERNEYAARMREG
jgi:hypothetical protein